MYPLRERAGGRRVHICPAAIRDTVRWWPWEDAENPLQSRHCIFNTIVVRTFITTLFLLTLTHLVAAPSPGVPGPAPLPDFAWTKVAGTAKKIAANGNKIYIIGTDDYLYQLNNATKAWQNVGRQVLDVAIDHQGHIWVIQAGNQIHRQVDHKWERIDGAAKGVAAGGTKLFVIGGDDMLYERNYSANSWVRAGRRVKEVAVDSENRIWTLEGKDFYRYGNGSWTKMDGWGQGIGAGGNLVLAIGENGALYTRDKNGPGWIKDRDVVQDMAVDGANRIWIVGRDGSIHVNGSL